ncbi:MAG: dienelactone hydrolase family protein, partial [Phycisphaerales bacterium]|nr:dienelactone hydrolase family protein [Phycisphaerales bacterium]
LAAYRAKNYDKALDLGKKLAELDPNNPSHVYNLGCLYSLKGDGDSAVKSLEKAGQLGFDDLSLLESDEDLASIRNRPEYKAVVETVKKNRGKTLETYREKAEKSEPLIYIPEGISTEKPVGCVVVLHPFGGTAEWIVERWKGAAKKLNMLLIAPRAVIPQGDGFRWQDAELTDKIVMKAVEHAKSKHKIDDKKMVISGFSEGGTMTFVMAIRHGDVFCGAIPVGGTLPDPIAGWDEIKKRKLPRFVVMIGDQEPKSTLDNNRDAAKKLEEAGAKVKLNVYPGIGHEFPKDTEKEMSEAVSAVTGG